MNKEEEQIDKIVKDFMDEAVPFLIKSHLNVREEKEIVKIREELDKTMSKCPSNHQRIDNG